LQLFIATSFVGVLRRPVEAAQYSETVMVESSDRGVLDSPLSRGMTPMMKRQIQNIWL
jgi:hypothetical protein